MNNLLGSIQGAKHMFFMRGFFLAIVVANYLNDQFFFACVVFAALVISIIRFHHDKKWLADADKYVRIPIKTNFSKTAVIIIASICIGITFQLDYAQDLLDKYSPEIHDASIMSWLAVGILLSISNYYQKFVDSIKSFDDGIQLPGRKSEIISWREIYEFKLEEKISISCSKGEHEFDFDPKDFSYARALVADWKSKNGRRK